MNIVEADRRSSKISRRDLFRTAGGLILGAGASAAANRLGIIDVSAANASIEMLSGTPGNLILPEDAERRDSNKRDERLKGFGIPRFNVDPRLETDAPGEKVGGISFYDDKYTPWDFRNRTGLVVEQSIVMAFHLNEQNIAEGREETARMHLMTGARPQEPNWPSYLARIRGVEQPPCHSLMLNALGENDNPEVGNLKKREVDFNNVEFYLSADEGMIKRNSYSSWTYRAMDDGKLRVELFNNNSGLAENEFDQQGLYDYVLAASMLNSLNCLTMTLGEFHPDGRSVYAQTFLPRFNRAITEAFDLSIFTEQNPMLLGAFVSDAIYPDRLLRVDLVK